jgi:queuosine precursor transporter
MQNYKILNHIVLWNIFFAIICIPTAGKLIDVMGIPLSISIYYFPFVYIFADILTEVYGYAIARRVLWYCIFAQLLMVAIFEFVIFYPPSAVMTNNQSYVDVLSAAPRLVLFGTLAMFAGDIANNYVLAKMKVWTNGRYMSARFVTSTLCGQSVNTGVFYIFGLWRMIPIRLLSKTRVRVHQLVKSLQGDVLSDSEVLHVFTVNSGLIAAMDFGDEADPNAGPSAAFAHRS